MKVVVLLLLNSAGRSVQSDSPEKRVEEVVARSFPEAGADRRRAYAARLMAALSAAPSPERFRHLIDSLPVAADYHASELRSWKERSLFYRMPVELLLEGCDIQFDQLEARVARAARAPTDPASKEEIRWQIERITQAARDALRERLKGELGSAFVDRHIERYRKSWLESVDLPFNAFMDAPLTEEKLGRAIEGIRREAQLVEIREVTEGDFRDPEREAKLTQVILNCVNTMLGAARLCYDDYDPRLARRQKEWEAKVDAGIREAIRAHNEEIRRKRRDEVRRGAEPAERVGVSSAPALSPRTVEERPHAPPLPEQSAPARGRTSSSVPAASGRSVTPAVFALLAFGAALVGWTLLRRKPGGPPA